MSLLYSYSDRASKSEFAFQLSTQQYSSTSVHLLSEQTSGVDVSNHHEHITASVPRHGLFFVPTPNSSRQSAINGFTSPRRRRPPAQLVHVLARLAVFRQWHAESPGNAGGVRPGVWPQLAYVARRRGRPSVRIKRRYVPTLMVKCIPTLILSVFHCYCAMFFSQCTLFLSAFLCIQSISNAPFN